MLIGAMLRRLPPAGLAPGWEPALELVDSALYLAKSHGRNRACGVRHCDAADLDALRQMAQQLEQAHAAGQVQLSHLLGPADPHTPTAPATPAAAAALAQRPGPASARPTEEAAP